MFSPLSPCALRDTNRHACSRGRLHPSGAARALWSGVAATFSSSPSALDDANRPAYLGCTEKFSKIDPSNDTRQFKSLWPEAVEHWRFDITDNRLGDQLGRDRRQQNPVTVM